MWYIIVGILAVAVVLWVSHLIARAVEARRAGFGWIILAIVFSMLVLLATAISGIVSNPLYLILVGIFTSIIIFSLVLGTGLLNGFYISIIYNIIFGIVLVIMLSIFFKVSLSDTFSNDPSRLQDDAAISKVQYAAEDVCFCGESIGCLIQKNRKLINLVYLSGYSFTGEDAVTRDEAVKRAKSCSFNLASYDPTSAIINITPEPKVAIIFDEQPASGAGMGEDQQTKQEKTATEPVTAAAPQNPTYKALQAQQQPVVVKSEGDEEKLEFRPIDFYEADSYINYAVRVKRMDDKVFTGIIYRVQGTAVYIKRRIYNGTAIIPVYQREIDTMEIYD